MKRRSRYSDEVIAFALTERGKGTKWKEIMDGIRREFKTKPPSERQMRSWYKYYGGGTTDKDRLVRETLIKVARDSTPAAAFQTQQFTIQQGIPALFDWYQRIKDPYIAGVVMILSTLEQMAGSELYEKGIKVYQQERERRGKSGKIVGWMNVPGPQPQPTPPIETHPLEDWESGERRQK